MSKVVEKKPFDAEYQGAAEAIFRRKDVTIRVTNLWAHREVKHVLSVDVWVTSSGWEHFAEFSADNRWDLFAEKVFDLLGVAR